MNVAPVENRLQKMTESELKWEWDRLKKLTTNLIYSQYNFSDYGITDFEHDAQAELDTPPHTAYEWVLGATKLLDRLLTEVEETASRKEI